ncbi:MAG: nitrite/sulfite reductase [Bacteroidota bacterium]
MSGQLNLKNISDAAAKDIIDLQQKITAFHQGKMQEERFKHFRLTRGVYGQRQLGVQMFRTKIPFGQLNTQQLIRLADVSERFTNGNLHLTTRQNIQLHHVKLNDSPAIWAQLAEVGVTARGACGNTVRNITASASAGIDPHEPFDVSPYVYATFQYFLRNPICQEMGRKVKIAFSSSEQDSAYTYIHDFGFIPKIKTINGEEVRGFKVVIGGGLGAQSIIAKTAYEFLPADEIIPFMEAGIRVFDRYGEREKRFKARMKFLVKKLGFEGFMELVEQERPALKNQKVAIDADALPQPTLPEISHLTNSKAHNESKYQQWLTANVFEQKQAGYYAAKLRVRLGDIDAETARRFARTVKAYAADDLRITVNQGLLLRFIRPEVLPQLFNELDELGLADPGFDSLADITACPGTDTCNLGVTNSTSLAVALEEVVREEYPHLINESGMLIKISGCMNSCGQHMIANIGFHGSSIKKKALVIPAMQIVIGGGVDAAGNGSIADKVIKLPTKRIPDALRHLLDDYEANAQDTEYFNDYYQRYGKRYFYDLLKPLADTEELGEEELIDWGQSEAYRRAIGVGECAGVAYDMVGTIINDARERILLARENLDRENWADSAYHSYSAQVIGAKALLLSVDVKCNTHKGIIDDFEQHFVQEGHVQLETDFATQVLRINKQEAGEAFAKQYYAQAEQFVSTVIEFRREQLKANGGDDQEVIGNYYNA